MCSHIPNIVKVKWLENGRAAIINGHGVRRTAALAIGSVPRHVLACYPHTIGSKLCQNHQYVTPISNQRYCMTSKVVSKYLLIRFRVGMHTDRTEHPSGFDGFWS